MLDYGNLSFISAQNPYVTLMRSGQAPPEPRPRVDAELYVYGWSRRVLYSSVEDPPPLSDAAFRQAFASRIAVLDHHHARRRIRSMPTC